MQFDIIEKAGLTQREFGDFCEVSRATVNLWVNGRMKPHRYIRDAIAGKIATVKAAVDAGRLPIDMSPGPDRERAIAAALNTAPAVA